MKPTGKDLLISEAPLEHQDPFLCLTADTFHSHLATNLLIPLSLCFKRKICNDAMIYMLHTENTVAVVS